MLDTQIIAKFGLGVFMGITLGVVVRYFLFRIFLLAAAPIIIMMILDYANLIPINWLYLEEQWNKSFTILSPASVRIYDYLSSHVLVGLIPGILASKFFFLKR